MNRLRELEIEMTSLHDVSDTESAHIQADAMLLQLIRYLANQPDMPLGTKAGVASIIKQYNSLKKWYA